MKSLRVVISALACLMTLSAVAEGIPEMTAPAAPVELRTARIRAAGDLMMHKKQLSIAEQADGSYDFHPQYALISDALANADYTIANLETTIGKYGKQGYSGYPCFNAPEAYLEAVRDAGVDFLTLANNHMLDRYLGGMIQTVDRVEEWGFDHGGANRSPEEKAAPEVVEVNGIRIGLLCYTEMTNGMEGYCRKEATEYGINYLKSANFAEDVARLREAGAEAIIAIPHWGEEYQRRPESNTVALAKKMIAAGVDVVLGSHPHMVQPVEYVTVETEDGTRTGLVAYSMGNFISNMSKQYTDSGIILDFTLREKQDGGFEAVDVGVVPVFCWRQDGKIRAVSALKYYDEKPEGMNADWHSRLRSAYRDLEALLGSEIRMLAE